jgi:long-chain acyl-CoA synthetase
MSQNLLPLSSFCHFEKLTKDKVYLRQPFNGEWIDYTWGDVGLEARKLASAIVAMNLPAKSSIALISKNCAHWIITDLAIWMAGHISVPLYPTLGPDSINYILNHSESKLVFVGKLDDWESQKAGVPTKLRKVHFPFWQNSDCESWDSFTKNSTPLESFPHPAPDDINTIIYTSGTTGNPKGVVHTFNSSSTHIRQAMTKLRLDQNDKFFSYLPLSHVAERLLVEMGSLYSGGTIYFAESLDTFKENLVFCKPTIFLAVPRIWLKFQQGILHKLPQKKLNLLLAIPIVNSIIRKKLQAALGLDHVRFAITGAAAIPKELLEWFDRIGISILEAYGMTENFGVSNLSLPGATRYGKVGKVYTPNTEVKIADNAEVLTRSEANMQGYYKEPEKTKETIDQEGWLHTADQGEFDQEGYLKITGRIKDAFKTSKGKYITPTKIEEHFSMCEFIEQVCLMGSSLPQPIAIVLLSEAGQKSHHEHVDTQLSDLLNHVNSVIDAHEQVSHVVIVQDEWSIANGLLTPTLKLKRNLVEMKYKPYLQDWSAVKKQIVRIP